MIQASAALSQRALRRSEAAPGKTAVPGASLWRLFSHPRLQQESAPRIPGLGVMAQALRPRLRPGGKPRRHNGYLGEASLTTQARIPLPNPRTGQEFVSEITLGTA